MLNDRLVFRKWGWYFTLIDGEHFKVKLLWFNMRDGLSYQRHELRKELWLFLKGWGSFNQEKRELSRVFKGEWRFVEVNEFHQYFPFEPTLVLEIQFGEKCDEEDIVRG